MAKEKNLNARPALESLEDAHQELYTEFQRDHMPRYTEIAKKLLDLQIEIFKRKLTDLLDKHRPSFIIELTLICTISARETVAALAQVLARIEKEQIKVAQVIYDPRTFTFHIYSQTT